MYTYLFNALALLLEMNTILDMTISKMNIDIYLHTKCNNAVSVVYAFESIKHKLNKQTNNNKIT